MKKLWLLGSIFAALLLCMVLLVLPVSATVYDGSCAANGTDDVTWSFDTETGVLTIAGAGKMADYTDESDDAAPWKSHWSYVTEVLIEDGVTKIGDYAFSGLNKLTNISIPVSVKAIGEWAFYNCYNLESITLNAENADYCLIDGVLYTKDQTTLVKYPARKSGVSFEIPATVTTISADAFARCAQLEEISIPDSVTSIGESAFWNCQVLTQVEMGANVESMGKYAFYACVDLEDIVIPDGVSKIETETFDACTSLKSVTIGSGVNSIDRRAFYGCSALEAVHISDIAAWCGISFEWSWYDRGNKTDYSANPLYYAKKLYLNGELVADLVIPESVTEISEVAFYNCRSLVNLVMGDHVTSIGDDAFANCSGLKSAYYHGARENLKINGTNNILENVLHYAGEEHTHIYGSLAQVSEQEHARFCLCGVSQNEAHSWHTGDVVKPATHVELGIVQIVCDCGYSYEEASLPMLTEHEFGQWQAHNELQHKRTCVCGHEEYTMHTWGEGVVITAPTLDAEGKTGYACNACGTMKQEVTAKLQPPAPEVEDEQEKGGCGKNLFGCKSTLTGSAGVMLMISLAGACLLSKKKED